MIVPILFLLAALSALTAGLLGGEIAHAKSASAAAAEGAAAHAISVAESGLLAQIQGVVAANVAAQRTAAAGIDGSFAVTAPLSPVAGTSFYVASEAHVDGATNAGGSGETALNLQTSSLAQEQRLSATVSVEVHAALANGSGPASFALATRSRAITLRVFAVPPYASFDGERDVGTADGTTQAEGDPAGVAAQPGDVTTPDPAQPDSYHDTTIKVHYECAGPDVPGVDPGNDGTPWGNGPGGLDEACRPTPPPWTTSPAPSDLGDGNAFAAPAPWTNSNTNQSGWGP